jgi:hypothetical protein
VLVHHLRFDLEPEVREAISLSICKLFLVPENLETFIAQNVVNRLPVDDSRAGRDCLDILYFVTTSYPDELTSDVISRAVPGKVLTRFERQNDEFSSFLIANSQLFLRPRCTEDYLMLLVQLVEHSTRFKLSWAAMSGQSSGGRSWGRLMMRQSHCATLGSRSCWRRRSQCRTYL